MEYDNTNSGALFKNAKRTNDRQPEYTGTLNVEGKEFWVSAWIKVSRNSGQKFFSIALTPKEETVSPATTSSFDSQDDDVPF